MSDSLALDTVERALGRPYCRGERYIVYRGDCLDLLGHLPDFFVDLALTSPPYNIGKEYETPRPIAEYAGWCAIWLKEIYRVTAPNGAFWLNLGYVGVPDQGRAVPLPYLLWDKSPFFLQQEIVWNYGAGVAARAFLSPRNEKLLWFVKNPAHYTFNLDAIRDPEVKYPLQKKNGKLRCNTIGKNPSDVWQIAKVTSGQDRASKERAPHPAQFPLDLVNRIVLGFSNPGDVVLDPFLGSGTTAESCIRLKRETVGFELNLDYCAYISRRLAKVEREQKELLFEKAHHSSEE